MAVEIVIEAELKGLQTDGRLNFIKGEAAARLLRGLALTCLNLEFNSDSLAIWVSCLGINKESRNTA